MKLKVISRGDAKNTKVVAAADGTPIDGVVAVQFVSQADGLNQLTVVVQVEGVHADIEAEATVTEIPDDVETEVITAGPVEYKSPDLDD